MKNWSGTYAYRATALHTPSSIDELCAIVAASERIRVLGTRHSFNDIADSTSLVSLLGIASPTTIAADRRTVTCSAAATYGSVAVDLAAAGLALHNLASLPHISVGGAIATATHGSGDRNGNLATAVAGLELVTSAGEVVASRRGDPDFDGLVVGLGACGAITRVTLDVQPTYEIEQVVYEGLTWDALSGQFDAITAAGDSVSLFTSWGDDVSQLWVKTRAAADADHVHATVAETFGVRAASGERHPVPEMPADNCTAQQGVAGPWHDRLPHFRMGFLPSSGDEIQSEYHVPRPCAPEAIEAMRALGSRMAPHLLISEVRTVAADDLWTSPQHERDTVSFHCTWKPDAPAVLRVLGHIEAALLPLGARPHWGKVFLADASTVAASYPRMPDFVDLVERMDPRGAFRNAWFERVIIGTH